MSKTKTNCAHLNITYFLQNMYCSFQVGCCEYRAVASLFGVQKISVHRYVHNFCAAIAQGKTAYIIWYGVEDAKNMASTIDIVVIIDL